MVESPFISSLPPPVPLETLADPFLRPPAPPRLSTLRPLGNRVFLLFAFLYLYSFSYFDRFRNPGELPGILLAQEIVERRTLRLDARLAELHPRPADRPGDPGLTPGSDTVRGPDGQVYAGVAPGPSFLAVPLYAALKVLNAAEMRISTWAFRVLIVTLPALLFLPFFYRLTARFTQEEPARRAALLAYALGSTALPDSVLFVSGSLAAIGLGGAFLAAVRLVREETRRPDLTALLVGVLAGAAFWMESRTLFLAPVLGLHVGIWSRPRIKNSLFFLLGVLPFAVALAAYNTRVFGSPLGGLLARGGLESRPGTLHALLLDPASSFLLLMPWVLLALVGSGAIIASRTIRRRSGAEAITALAVVVVYLVVLVLAPSPVRSGWAVGPRQLGPILPFLGWLAAAGFAVAYRRLGTQVVAQALVLASAVIFLAAASTFPYWPEQLKNPLYELTFPLVRNGYAAPSLGRAFGLAGGWALVPPYMVALLLAGWLLAWEVRQGVLSTGLALLLAGGLLFAHGRWLPSSGPAADESWRFVTSLWRLPPAPVRRPPAPPPQPIPAAAPPEPAASAVSPEVLRPRPPRKPAASSRGSRGQPIFTPGEPEPRPRRKTPPRSKKRRPKPIEPEVELL